MLSNQAIMKNIKFEDAVKRTLNFDLSNFGINIPKSVQNIPIYLHIFRDISTQNFYKL